MKTFLKSTYYTIPTLLVAIVIAITFNMELGEVKDWNLGQFAAIGIILLAVIMTGLAIADTINAACEK